MTHQIVIVEDRKFDSKSAAKEYYRKILNLDPIGRLLSDREKL